MAPVQEAPSVLLEQVRAFPALDEARKRFVSVLVEKSVVGAKVTLLNNGTGISVTVNPCAAAMTII